MLKDNIPPFKITTVNSYWTPNGNPERQKGYLKLKRERPATKLRLN